MPNLGGIVAAFSQRRRRFNAATGGTEATISNYNGTGQTWKTHRFTTVGNSTLTMTAIGASALSYLMVGGGGGGDSGGGGGGGGGGYLSGTSTLTIGAFAVVIGNGGGGGGSYPAGNYSAPGSGGNSTFNSLTAIGGGSGGGQNYKDRKSVV